MQNFWALCGKTCCLGKGQCQVVKGFTYGHPNSLRNEVPQELHVPFSSSFLSSRFFNLLSQGAVVLRPRLGDKDVSNYGAGVVAEGDSTCTPACKG